MFQNERSAVSSLGLIFSFRMLGLFMILPVFVTSADKMPGATLTLVGVALGIYGLTQALLQIPFGMLSDKIGRKPVIAMGLILFAAGAVVAALSHSIYGIIIGRALQGAGAIGSTILATVADLTRDENRSKAMAFIGLSIGVAFTLAIILGPIINAWFQLSGIFWVTAGLALIGLVLLFTVVPTPSKLLVDDHIRATPGKFNKILKNTQLLRLNWGIFTLHSMLTILFLAVPILLQRTLKLGHGQEVFLYLIVLVVAFVLAVPLIIIAEKRRKMKSVFIGAIVGLLIAEMGLLFFHRSAVGVSMLLLIFFTAFTLLEASLPSLVSKLSPIHNRGTAMGVYSASQFFGIFVGGVVGGLCLNHFGVSGVFLLGGAFALVWLLIAATMKQPPYLSTIILGINPASTLDLDQLKSRLTGTPGVAEVALTPDNALMYCKIDKKLITEPELRNILATGNVTDK